MPMERVDWSMPGASFSLITLALLLFYLNGCASLSHLRLPPVNPRLVTANKLARRMSKPEGCWTGQRSRIACTAIMSHSLPECSLACGHPEGHGSGRLGVTQPVRRV